MHGHVHLNDALFERAALNSILNFGTRFLLLSHGAFIIWHLLLLLDKLSILTSQESSELFSIVFVRTIGNAIPRFHRAFQDIVRANTIVAFDVGRATMQGPFRDWLGIKSASVLEAYTAVFGCNIHTLFDDRFFADRVMLRSEHIVIRVFSYL